MKFYYFHLMPYPMDHDGPSSWVTLSNRHYDPAVGHTLYNQYLDQLEYAEQLGWDGLCVNEHHQNCYGTMPSPNVMAAMLVRRTRRAKIAILGNGLPLRENPLRLAEEIAMLDVASGGRVISGFVRGISAEYFSTAVNPTHSRERFYEAAELILKAWTEEGPFPFDGRFYRYPYVNPWPRPLQKPHPPVWCPSQGSNETVEWAAKRRFPYLMVFTPITRIAQIYGEYREACERHGYTASRYQLTVNLPIVVAETTPRPTRWRGLTRCGSITWGSAWRRPSGARPATSRSRRSGACSTIRPRCPRSCPSRISRRAGTLSVGARPRCATSSGSSRTSCGPASCAPG
jgi:hypothetical protein